MKNLTSGQILALVICTLGVLTTSETQLDVVIGVTYTKVMIALSTISISVLSGWMAILFGQSSQIAAVSAMPGVEKITVNAKANQTLAAMATDVTQDKISPIPSETAAVAATAKGS